MVDMEGRAEYTEFDESISLLHARQRMETRGRVVNEFHCFLCNVFVFFFSEIKAPHSPPLFVACFCFPLLSKKKFWEITILNYN